MWVAFSLCVDSFAASKIQVIFEVEEESKGTSTTYLSLQAACPNFLEVLGLSLSKNSNPGVLFASLLIHCWIGTSKQGKMIIIVQALFPLGLYEDKRTIFFLKRWRQISFQPLQIQHLICPLVDSRYQPITPAWKLG